MCRVVSPLLIGGARLGACRAWQSSPVASRPLGVVFGAYRSTARGHIYQVIRADI